MQTNNKDESRDQLDWDKKLYKESMTRKVGYLKRLTRFSNC
jgi:hypothetical protein